MKMKAISAVMNATYNPHICYWVLIFCYICFLPSQDTKILKNRSIWTDLVVCFVKKVLIYFYFATWSHCCPTSICIETEKNLLIRLWTDHVARQQQLYTQEENVSKFDDFNHSGTIFAIKNQQIRLNQIT